ncbi:MAG: hypothetical protein RDU25_05700 [Patescibacteria group bacterium]|nr:hypothetical protein [Patescibacteria group bacterium]
MSRKTKEEKLAENKRLYQALEQQTCPADNGVRQVFTTGLSNLIPGITPPPGMRLVVSNIPRVSNGFPVLVSNRELCVMQLNQDPELIAPEQLAALDAATRQRFEHYQELPLMEYERYLDLEYGRFDQVAPEDALKLPAIRGSGGQIKDALKDGVMDVVVIKPDTHQLIERTDRDGKKYQVSVPIKRGQSYRINLYDLSRAMSRPVGETFKIFGRKGGPMKFVRLAGHVENDSRGQRTVATHVIVGCMPSRDARRANTDRPISVGAAGRDGRGIIFIIELPLVKVAIWTYQTLILPGFDYSKPEPEIEGLSLMVSWLSLCPSPKESVAFMDKLLEGTAEAITSDKDNEGIEKINLDDLLAGTTNETSTSSADAVAVNGDATDASEDATTQSAQAEEGAGDATEEGSEDDAPKAIASDDDTPDSNPATETAAEATAADAAPATDTHVEIKPATADLLD